MERGGPLFSWIKKPAAVMLIASFAGGCAVNARDLPEDYGSMDAGKRLSVEDFDPATARLTCAEIAAELKLLESEHSLQARDITDKRQQNQVAGYIGGVFFLPVLLATDNSAEAKNKIENINRAKDKLYQAQVFKKCPSG